MGFFDFMTEDIAIDLGTANTLIIHNDNFVIVNDKSISGTKVYRDILGHEIKKSHKSFKGLLCLYKF